MAEQIRDGTGTSSQLKVNSDGSMNVNTSEEFKIPSFDSQVIDESDANNVIVTYKLNGVVVATKTIVVSGDTTTVSVVIP